ncbi:MAG: iron-sulfur cluster repair di-iron protein [Pirellulales bacterium]|nr:iron-sulfur cluster repair di-iron protein [Pirellulales bacterium]
MTAQAETTLAELVRQHPQRARLFSELGLDFCCHGGQTLAAACQQRGLDVADVCRRLDEQPPDAADDQNWHGWPLARLIDDIVSRHHAYVRRQLPHLRALCHTVHTTHGAAHPELHMLQAVLAELADELTTHMFKEERVLFPWVKQLEAGTATGAPPFGTVQNPICVMEDEHRRAADALEHFRLLTHNYSPPADACPAYEALLADLRAFDADLRLHIYKENHVLFPRALELEAHALSHAATMPDVLPLD